MSAPEVLIREMGDYCKGCYEASERGDKRQYRARAFGKLRGVQLQYEEEMRNTLGVRFIRRREIGKKIKKIEEALEVCNTCSGKRDFKGEVRISDLTDFLLGEEGITL